MSEDVAQIVIRNSKGQLLSIVQAKGGGHGIMGNENSGQVEIASLNPLADAPDGYLDAKALADALLHFEKHGTNPAQTDYEEDMHNLYYDNHGWTMEDINIMEREMLK